MSFEKPKNLFSYCLHYWKPLTSNFSIILFYSISVIIISIGLFYPFINSYFFVKSSTYIIFYPYFFFRALAFEFFLFVPLFLILDFIYKWQQIDDDFAIGLRIIYIMSGTCSMFICKHCLKTIIVKQLHITCSFCNSNYEITDGKDIITFNNFNKWTGDNPHLGNDYVLNENALEYVLFNSCPICKSKLPGIECPHCHNEINFLEHYDSKLLELKRYE